MSKMSKMRPPKSAITDAPRTTVAPPPQSSPIAAALREMQGFRIADQPRVGRPNLGPHCHKCGSQTLRAGTRKSPHPFLVRIEYECKNAKCRERITVERRRG
ncbi:MAG: hypothetical protein BWX86_01147 [Verrucomicrobia bacterium ADurb.Bin122]|nr:MAG: hypothetical protein BWX86_01147 [Verrucomicrobia bacterium ADurb.Bin122]